MYASRWGKTEVVRLLLEDGRVDVNLKDEVSNRWERMMCLLVFVL